MNERVNLKVLQENKSKSEQYKKTLDFIYSQNGEKSPQDPVGGKYFSSQGVDTTWDSTTSYAQDNFSLGQMNQMWDENEVSQNLEKQLLSVQETLQELGPDADPDIVQGLENQEKDLIAKVNNNRENQISVSNNLRDTKVDIERQNKDRANSFFEKLNNSDLVEASFEEIKSQDKGDAFAGQEQGEDNVINDPQEWLARGYGENLDIAADKKQADAQGGEKAGVDPEKNKDSEDNQQKQETPLDDTTQGVLRNLGFSYENLIQEVPDFSFMSEGQRAYILRKSEEQSFEHIQEKSDEEFQKIMSKGGRATRFFRRIFKSNSIRRKTKKSTLEQHQALGLAAMKEDISHMTQHVKDGGWDIALDESKAGYRIEYIPESKDGSSRIAQEYNKAATNLSDIPYEWSLATATPAQKKAFQKAHGEFKAVEKQLRETAKDSSPEDHAVMVEKIMGLETQVELNQFFSSYPDISGKLKNIENSNVWSDLKNKFILGASSTALGGTARFLSKSLWGLGGAVGASSIVGGILAWRRKNKEFKEDSMAARRGQDLKKTTDKVFEADKNTNRIYKLIDQLDRAKDEKSKERTLEALENRLQLLDERLKDGRINFGKAKDQLKNKHHLMEAMTAAHMFRYELSQNEETNEVSNRVLKYFDAQDKASKKSRRTERVKAVAIGATIGAAGAAAGWMIADYFMGGRDASGLLDNNTPVGKVPMAPDTDVVIGKIPIEYSPTDFNVNVEASSKGLIQTIVDLREKISLTYPDLSQAPDGVQEFMDASQNPTQYAMDEKMFVPGQTNESGVTMKGDRLGINKSGHVIYDGARSGVNDLTTGDFTGEHFDYGARQAAQVNAENATQSSAWKSTVEKVYDQNMGRPVDSNGNPIQDRPGLFDKKFEGGRVVSNDRPMSVAEEIEARARREAAQVGGDNIFANEVPTRGTAKIFNGFDVDYAISENSDGVREFRIGKEDISRFNTYHSAYFPENTSVNSFANKLYSFEGFRNSNPGSSLEKITSQLNEVSNNIIVRDQMMASGEFPKGGEEYNLLKSERDRLLKYINTISKDYVDQDESLFAPLNDSVKKNPDVSLFVDNSSSVAESGPAVYEGSQAGTVKLEDVSSENLQDVDFTFEKNSSGEIVGASTENGTIKNLGSIDINQYGFNENWVKDSGLDQTFTSSSAEGKQSWFDIQKLKRTIAYRDAFPKGSPEYSFFDKNIAPIIKKLDASYPKMFN